MEKLFTSPSRRRENFYSYEMLGDFLLFGFNERFSLVLDIWLQELACHHLSWEAQNCSFMHNRFIDPWHDVHHCTQSFLPLLLSCKDFPSNFLKITSRSSSTVNTARGENQKALQKNTTCGDYDIVYGANLTAVLELQQWKRENFFWRFLFCLFRILHCSVRVSIISRRRPSTLCANLIYFGPQYCLTNPK